MMTDKKKKNYIAAYFTPFGLKQLCDITMVLAAIVIIVGMCITGVTFVVAFVGSILMALGAAIAILRCVKVFTSGINNRSAAYKNAIINVVIMGIIFALSVFLAIYLAVVHM